MAQRHVAIIGAGMGGLAAAIRLAARGERVSVYEAGAGPGGKLNRWQSGGYTFDTGPSLLTMPWVLRELFAAAGRDMDDALTLDRVDPICCYHFADGSTLEVTSDTARMAANIERLSPPDVPAFFRFLAHTANLYALAGDPFLRHPMDTSLFGRGRTEMFRYGFRARDLPKFAAPRTVHQTVASFFRDPRLRMVFDRYATYNGSSPYHAPAAFCIIPFVEFATGAWHPRGGMYRIAETLAALAADLGVALHHGTPVARITLDRSGTRATGLHLADGEHVAADAVISNVDVLTTHDRLLDGTVPGVLERRAALRRLEPSYSGFVLLLGTRRTYDRLPHHSIYFSADYEREFGDVVRRRVPPADPTIYVCRTTATDPAAAPPGGDNLFVMVNVPYLDGRTDWDALAPRYRDKVLAALAARGLEVRDADIAVEDRWTPERFRAAYGAQAGALYGFASNTRRAAFLRPPNRSPDFAGLYFAGGSTHPGGGVPLALLSGGIVAEMIAGGDSAV